MKIRFVFILVGIAFLLSAGCADTESPAPAADSTASIADAGVAPGEPATDTTTPVASDAGVADDASESHDAAAEQDASPRDATPPDDPSRPPIDESFDTFIGDWNMASGKEVTKCVRKRLDNPEAIWVSEIQTRLEKGSHHVIVYRSDQDTEIPEPFDCDPFVETLSGETIPLIITQISEETLKLPPGVAFKFEPNQMIRIEAHFLNYFPEDITAHADVSFKTIAQEDVTDEADMLFYGTPDFSIAPGEEYTTPWHFIDVWEDTKVFAVTGHTHQYGTNVEITKSTSKEDQGLSIYPKDTPFNWSEAPIEQFDPPLTFAQGDGLRYRCTWNNTGDKTLTFGESANQEMCFLWAYYYPSKGYRLCVNPGDIANGFNIDGFEIGEQICCPDDAFLCQLVKSYLGASL